MSEKPPVPLSAIIDRLEFIREEMLCLQHSLEEMERADLQAKAKLVSLPHGGIIL
jgi:hypothetical protein